MSRIRAEHTKPEKIVRSVLHKAGYRYRLHVGSLPGKPDIVLSKYKTVVFVHGCFWHRHKRCKFAYTPKSRTRFWTAKFVDNVKRDKVVKHGLVKIGWNYVVVWECQVSDPDKWLPRVEKLLRKGNHNSN